MKNVDEVFGDIDYVVTHPGGAHRDEYLACSIILTGMEQIQDRPVLYRHDPTQAELDSPKVAVIDVGGRHEPGKLNFDHHQLPRDAVSTCALSLVLQALDIYPLAKEIWRWLRWTEIMDSKGPMTWTSLLVDNILEEVAVSPSSAKTTASCWSLLSETLSPIESSLLAEFSRVKELAIQSPVAGTMWWLGYDLLKHLTTTDERLKVLPAYLRVFEVSGLQVVSLPEIHRDQDPVLALEMYFRKAGLDPAITITHDDRGPGWTLFRRNDHPRVNFSVLEGDPRIIFAHKNGFVAKTATKADPLPLIQKAIS